MADSIHYGMGQIRYNNNTSYMTNLQFNFEPVRVLVSSDNETNDVYQDIVLKRNDSFSFTAGVPYLLKIKIPKDINYNNTYRIKMTTTNSEEATALNPDAVTYQMIKYINVPKETSSSTSSRVIIYPVTSKETVITEDEETIVIPAGSLWEEKYNIDYITKVAIAIEDGDEAATQRPGGVWFKNNKYYLMGATEGEDQEILNKSDVILNHLWATGHSTSWSEFNFVFTPRDSDETYTQIWIEMFRESYDQDIYSDGIYGRQIDLEGGLFEASVYQLTNMINNIQDVEKLTHIGVYGHPNAIMAINGEEIRIGQSGYYELNNFEITSFGIAAETNNDNDTFIVDYQYPIE